MKKYQPERVDLLINTDWGISKSQLTKEEANSQGLVLYKKRWVSAEDKNILKKQYSAYEGCRQVGNLFIAGAFCVTSIFFMSCRGIVIRFFVDSWSPDELDSYPSLALGLELGFMAFLSIFIGLDIRRYRRWAYYPALAMLAIGMWLILEDLLLFFSDPVFPSDVDGCSLVILSAAIHLTVMFLVTTITLLQKPCREILLGNSI